jgi:acetyl esterase/lipase
MRTKGRRIASVVASLVAVVTLTVGCVDGGPPKEEQASWMAYRDVFYARGQTLDIYVPRPGPEVSPVVVLFHGCCGDRTNLTQLAEALAAGGATVFNVDWPGIDADARYPDAYEMVACAVRFARTRAASYGAEQQRLALLGWSDGALVGAVVALHGESYSPQECVVRSGSAAPDLLVGVAGFYGWPLPVPSEYVTERAVRFMGGTPQEADQAWRDATPYAWVQSGPRIPTLLLVSMADPLRYDALAFAGVLLDAGNLVRTVSVEPHGDTSMLSSRTFEGRTTVAETLRALRELPAVAADWPGHVIVTPTDGHGKSQ